MLRLSGRAIACDAYRYACAPPLASQSSAVLAALRCRGASPAGHGGTSSAQHAAPLLDGLAQGLPCEVVGAIVLAVRVGEIVRQVQDALAERKMALGEWPELLPTLQLLRMAGAMSARASWAIAVGGSAGGHDQSSESGTGIAPTMSGEIISAYSSIARNAA